MDATQPQPTQKIIKILQKNKKNNIEKQFKEYSIPIVEPHEDLAIMATPPPTTTSEGNPTFDAAENRTTELPSPHECSWGCW